MENNEEKYDANYPFGRGNEPHVLPVRYTLPPGFTAADILQPAYGQPLAACTAPMVEQCHALLEAIREPDFVGGTALDCSLNGAQVLVEQFFECLADYEEGRVPFHVTDELVDCTDTLIAAEMERYPAARAVLCRLRQVFHRSHVVWRIRRELPRMSREVYLRHLFEAKRKIIEALCESARAIDAAETSGGETSGGGKTGGGKTGGKRRRGRPRAMGSVISQVAAARDFGVSRKTIGTWEREQTCDGPENRKNPYGYYRSLRTDPTLRGSYNLLVSVVAEYHRLQEKNRREGGRTITFVAFNEAWHRRQT